MTRVEATRTQLYQLVRATPFRPFALNFENGDRVFVDHPENVAFDIHEGGVLAVLVISNKIQYFGTLSAITTMAVLDRGQLAMDRGQLAS